MASLFSNVCTHDPDPSTTFLSLPGELRNRIYELVLLHDEPIDPLVYFHGEQKFTPGLLRANKVVHHEASSVLYSQNVFDLTEATPEGVDLFLERVGSNNSGYIRYLLIDFPSFLHLDPGNVTLDDNSICILATIQSSCANLRKITTSLHSTNSMELWLDELDNHKVATEALKLVDTRLRAISSIQDIVVQVYEDGPSDHIRRSMKSHGWTVSTTEHVVDEDWGRSFSDFDDYEYRYDYDSGGGEDDDYDIDNDSDFWRRAAD